MASQLGMGAFVIFCLHSTAQERTVVFRLVIGVAAGVALTLLAAHVHQFDALLAAGASIPVVIFAFLAWQSARSEGAERSDKLDLLAATTIIGAVGPAMVFFLDLSVKYFNPIYDALYIRIDELFGAQPSAVVAFAFHDVPPLAWLCMGVYFLLPLAQAFVAALEARDPHPTGELGILPGFIVTALIGYALYALMPAIGPLEYLGRSFPMLHIGSDYLATRSAIDTNPADLRGAMPSLHITWATLLFLATRRMRPSLQLAGAAFLLLTFLATLGLGMHYLIDLIVAAPLIVLVRALLATDMPWRARERVSAIVAGVVLLAVWVAVTHAGINVEAARGFFYAAMAVTLIVPLLTGLRLERARGATAARTGPTPVLARRYPQMPSLTQ
ncbi:MAG TPA: phosphatase PAP2 family protein [Bauldia sp.]|nr:phosphatase PAP2 family protein [Bauldia sp.]